jgi:hypothetical protein
MRIGGILPHSNIFQHEGDASDGDMNHIGTSMSSSENSMSTYFYHFVPCKLHLHTRCHKFFCTNDIRLPRNKSLSFNTSSESDLLSLYSKTMSDIFVDDAFSSELEADTKCQLVAYLIEHKESLVSEEEYDLVIKKAEVLFRKGIDYLDTHLEMKLRCCYHLVSLLRAHGNRQSEEIYHLLCSIISTNVRFPRAFMNSCRCTLRGAIYEFSELYREIDEVFWRTITGTLDELSEILKQMGEKPLFTGDVLSFEVRYSIIALAGQFSENLEFAVAELLLFVPDSFDPLSAYVYLQRCLNYQRQDKLQKSFRELQNARKALFTSLPILLNYERTLLETCNYLGLVLASLRNINNDELRLPIKMGMKRAIEEWLQEHVSHIKLATFPDKESILDSLMSKSKGIGSSDNSSARYGVTYSVSTITGVSDSVFMVP